MPRLIKKESFKGSTKTQLNEIKGNEVVTNFRTNGKHVVSCSVVEVSPSVKYHNLLIYLYNVSTPFEKIAMYCGRCQVLARHGKTS